MMAPPTAGSGALTPRVRAALRLRSRLLRLLGPGASGDESPSEPAVWELVLSSERCARPVARALASAGARERLPPPVGEVLRRRLEVESRRVLAARVQLADVAEVARKEGFRPVVLKGGVELMADDALGVADLDLLLPPAAVDPFTHVLERRGYRPTGGRSLHHGRPLTGPGGGLVEVHFELPAPGIAEASLWDGARPFEGAEGLFRLAPGHHLWHVLHHAAVQNPNRRGRLRDLVLTGRALAACTEAELASVGRRIADHGQAPALRSQWAMARTMARGEPVEDAFRAEAASHYLLRELFGRPRRFPGWAPMVFDAAVARLGTPEDRRRAWRTLGRFTGDPSRIGPVAALEARAPALGREVRVLVRRARHLPIAAAGWLVAAAARWLARAAS